MLFWKAVKIESCAACHVNSQGLCYMSTFKHQRMPAAQFNNIFLKLFHEHATYIATY